MTSRTDQQLVRDANAGDESAFTELYEQHKEWVTARAYYLTQNREDALDVLQETFEYLFGKFPGFELRAQMKTFLFPVVRNLSLTRIRKRRPQVAIDEAADALPSIAADVSAEADDEFGALLSPLPVELQEMVILRFKDGFSLAEIADGLDLPLGTVKSRLHNALKALREHPNTKKHFS